MAVDPYLMASTSLGSRLGRVAWGLGYVVLMRYSPRPFHGWRSAILRLFGARLGPNCHVYPGARVWAPWNLLCEDAVGIADGAVIYNPALISLASHSIVSQDAYLCGATHDFNDPSFAMVSKPISIGRYAWIAARAIVSPGVAVGEGAVLGIGSIATRDLEPWTVYAGAPARPIGVRVQHHAT